MGYISQIAFIVALGVAGYFLTMSVKRIVGNIKLGKKKEIKDRPGERLKQMILLAFGQKKMFARPIPAILHLFVYLGFLLVNLEIIEIVLDGILGTHRLFAPFFGSLYPYLINFFEFFAVTVLIGCSIFLIRRNVLNISRFHKPELTKWPLLDANLILTFEIVLMIALLKMNAIDQILQSRGAEHYHQTGGFFFSGLLIPLINSFDFSTNTLIAFERTAWWFHILGVLAFANYVPYSKHLHIFIAFPNTYFAKLNPAGEIDNMPTVTAEVKSMLGMPADPNAPALDPNAPLRFGARDANELDWNQLLGAYACTECGRCTAVCPANLTGKKLSPRKVMMDTRDRIEEIGENAKANNGTFVDDGKALFSEEYVSQEELLACTTCNACTDACPININPLDIIVQLRRYMIMEESKAPQSWNAMFSNMETSFAPWKFSPSDRFNWANKLNNEGV